MRFPEPWSSTSLANQTVLKTPREKFVLDRAFAPIEGHPRTLIGFDYPVTAVVRLVMASARISAVPLKAKISTRLPSPLSMSEGFATMIGM